MTQHLRFCVQLCHWGWPSDSGVSHVITAAGPLKSCSRLSTKSPQLLDAQESQTQWNLSLQGELVKSKDSSTAEADKLGMGIWTFFLTLGNTRQWDRRKQKTLVVRGCRAGPGLGDPSGDLVYIRSGVTAQELAASSISGSA